MVELHSSTWSILPSLVVIFLAILTRKIILSLSCGLIVGAILIANFDIWQACLFLLKILIGVFWDINSGLDYDRIYIIVFLLFLGIVASFITLNGGTKAFGDWVIKRVKTRVAAQFSTMALGMAIFIDDYFNNLAVGNISRPVTDLHKVSRTKLAYIIDSTSAPICILTPLSSWGAYIIALLAPILASHNFTEHSSLIYFIMIIPMNFYPLVALMLVALVIYFNFNIGPMSLYEKQAYLGNVSWSKQKTNIKNKELPSSNKGSVYDLIIPFIILVFSTTLIMILTGYWSAIEAKEQSINFIKIFEYTRSELSLFMGGFFSLIAVLYLAIKKKTTSKIYSQGIRFGIKSMMPAVYILFFAWSLVQVISILGTGVYISNILNGWLAPQWLPLLLFLVAGITAFCTGTSWGTFGIMLPIAAEVSILLEISLLLPSLGAVLAGAVFGDHCSPISDTTILASVGARCQHIDHFITQLPYAIIAASLAALGYIVLGFSQSILISIITITIAFILLTLAISHNASKYKDNKDLFKRANSIDR